MFIGTHPASRQFPYVSPPPPPPDRQGRAGESTLGPHHPTGRRVVPCKYPLPLSKAKSQYLLTFNLSRYCLLAFHGGVAMGLPPPWQDTHSNGCRLDTSLELLISAGIIRGRPIDPGESAGFVDPFDLFSYFLQYDTLYRAYDMYVLGHEPVSSLFKDKCLLYT